MAYEYPWNLKRLLKSEVAKAPIALRMHWLKKAYQGNL